MPHESGGALTGGGLRPRLNRDASLYAGRDAGGHGGLGDMLSKLRRRAHGRLLGGLGGQGRAVPSVARPDPARPSAPSQAVGAALPVYRPLGAMRFALALLVVIQHAQYVSTPKNLSFFLDMGFGIIAVIVFFVMSGFVVGDAHAMFYAGRPLRFLFNRLLRLLPAFVAALAVSVAVHTWLYEAEMLRPWDYHLIGPPWQLRLLLSGLLDVVPFYRPSYIGSQDFSFVPFAWSLRIEFLFYLLIAAVFYWARVFPPRLRTRLLGTAFAAMYAVFAGYVISHKSGPQQTDAIPFFLFGIALFRVSQRATPWRLLNAVASACCVFVALALWNQRGHPELAMQAPVLALLLVILVALVFVRRPGSGWILWDRRLGGLSYPLYINHFAVLLPLSNLLTVRAVWLQVTGVLLSVALAVVMFVLVEVPLRGLRDKVRGTPL